MDLSGYNKEQQNAILDIKHNLMILACAGSGKTKTIIGKIAYEIEQNIVDPHEVCAVTFTNRAADEMRARLKELIGEKWQKVTVRTFHSLGVMLLRHFAEKAGLDNAFSIANDIDVRHFVKMAMGCDDKEAKRLAIAILCTKEHGYAPNSKEAAQFFGTYDHPSDIIYAYEKVKQQEQALDFPDLIIRAVALLRKDEEVRNYCHSRYKLVIVDEYQDSNVMQSKFLQIFSGEKTRVVVVGDDDQSIYAFRGAEVKNILSFPQQFKNVRQIALLKNYRSTSEILVTASAVIGHNSERFQKDIVSALDKHGHKPFYINSKNGYVEAEAIADIIKDDGDFASYAVLYRKHRTVSILKRILLERHIPYTVAGGVGVLESAIVKTAIAFLRICLSHKDGVAVTHVLKKSRIGLGDEAIKKIFEKVDKKDGDIMKACIVLINEGYRKNGLTTFVETWKNAEKVLFEDVTSEKVFETEYEASKAIEEAENVTTGDVIRNSLIALGIKEAERPVKDENNKQEDNDDEDDNLGVYVDMINNMDSFYDSELIAKEDVEPSRMDVLQCFIVRSELGDDAGRDKAIGTVTLSTMHAAKGLEFENVFLIGLEDDLIPGKNTEGKALDEERRIFYVAMTRAKKTLYFCNREYDGTEYVKKGGLQFKAPSRFLKEIPYDDISVFVKKIRKFKKKLESKRSEYLDYKKGDRINHQEAGDGTVTAVIKQPDKTILVALFDNTGSTRKLIAGNPKVTLVKRVEEIENNDS